VFKCLGFFIVPDFFPWDLTLILVKFSYQRHYLTGSLCIAGKYKNDLFRLAQSQNNYKPCTWCACLAWIWKFSHDRIFCGISSSIPLLSDIIIAVFLILEMDSRYFNPRTTAAKRVNKHHTSQDPCLIPSNYRVSLRPITT
jgi:hypothetical protein